MFGIKVITKKPKLFMREFSNPSILFLPKVINVIGEVSYKQRHLNEVEITLECKKNLSWIGW